MAYLPPEQSRLHSIFHRSDQVADVGALSGEHIIIKALLPIDIGNAPRILEGRSSFIIPGRPRATRKGWPPPFRRAPAQILCVWSRQSPIPPIIVSAKGFPSAQAHGGAFYEKAPAVQTQIKPLCNPPPRPIRIDFRGIAHFLICVYRANYSAGHISFSNSSTVSANTCIALRIGCGSVRSTPAIFNSSIGYILPPVVRNFR